MSETLADTAAFLNENMRYRARGLSGFIRPFQRLTPARHSGGGREKRLGVGRNVADRARHRPADAAQSRAGQSVRDARRHRRFGAGSKFSWQFFGGCRHDFEVVGAKLAGLAGYRGLGVDFSKWVEGRENGINAVLHGPITGGRREVLTGRRRGARRWRAVKTIAASKTMTALGGRGQWSLACRRRIACSSLRPHLARPSK